MFDGGVPPEQLRHFIVSPPPPQPPAPQPPPARAIHFPLSFSSFETTNHFMTSILDNSNHKIIHHHHHRHQHRHQNHNHHDGIKDGGASGWMGHTGHDGDDDDDDGHHHQWSGDEVLALLRLRSTVENWFPGFTWEHISRKLTEVGFKRTPQECKDKFEEEERRYFNDNHSNDHINDFNHNNSEGKGNIRMFSELEEFYHHQGHHAHHDDDHDHHVSSEVGHSQNKRQKSLDEEPRSQAKDKMGQDLEEDPREEEEDEEGVGINQNGEGKSGNHGNDGKSSSSSSSAMVMMMMMREKKKRKREREKEGFEMLKGFCEGLVRNMIAQQEEMHRKILEDMVKRDEEKIEREEAWKKQETERINKEFEIRAHEQALASDRNSTIIKFITKFTPSSEHDHHHDHDRRLQQQHQHGNKAQSPSTSQSSSFLPQTPSSTNIPTISSSQTLTSQNPLPLHNPDEKSPEPISVQTLKTKTPNPKPPKSDETNDLGKRWPRDEVLALVNIRCSISTKINDDHHHHHEDQHHKDRSSSSSSKAPPLWERISKKMLESGYKRSAKRCKEKWENINKYFRKTKDVNKKRPLDSRTCPYFHHLSALYSQGSLAGAGKVDSGDLDPENPPDETRVGSWNNGSGDDPNMHVATEGDDDEKINTVQASSFDFEF